MKGQLNLERKKDQQKAKLALIKLIVDPKTKLQQISIWPSECGINSLSFRYSHDNTATKK